MLSRIYIDNYRTFVNFECRFGRKQLLLGGNGSGKTSLLGVVLGLRQVIANDGAISALYRYNQTRWMEQARQVFELDAELTAGTYTYRLVIEPVGEGETPAAIEETLKLDGRELLSFTNGEVRLYNDSFVETAVYPFDWQRSALNTIAGRKENQLLMAFKAWAVGVYSFHLQPGLMESKAEAEDFGPQPTLRNFAGWYRHLALSDSIGNGRLGRSLAEAMPGFRQLVAEAKQEGPRWLVAEFENQGGAIGKYAFNELSDGQRCLICLYAVAHFLLASGATLVIDEPDNYVSLREIQPWLNLVEEMIDEGGKGQLLLISHHPEVLNQWAPAYGLHFYRSGAGATKIRRFGANINSPLSPAELIARGWEDE